MSPDGVAVSPVDVPPRERRCLQNGMPESSSAVPDQQPSQDRDRVLLVSVARAGEILSLSRSSIYQLIWTDQLTPVRIGRSVRFSVEHLEEFVADRTADSQR